MARSKMMIGSDFSEYSSQAIEVGLEWAQKMGSDPYVFHINNSRHSNDGIALLNEQQHYNVEGIFEGLKKDLKERLSEQVHESGAKNHSSVNVEVLFGKRSELLPKRVKELNAKMLVLGSLGQGGLEDIFLGGTTERAIRSVQCPILAVRDLRAKAPKKILWASELSPESDFAFEWVAYLAQMFKSRVHVVHMLEDHKEARGMDDSEKGWEFLQQKRAILTPKLIEYENKFTQMAIKASCSLERAPKKNIQKGLAQLIDESDADLVVLGTHARQGLERFFMGSVAESLTHSVRRSFFIVKDQAQ